MREETHLTMPEKISKLLMLLGLGLSLAMLMGEFQVEITKQVKIKLKKNKRYAGRLQNLIFLACSFEKVCAVHHKTK